MTKETSQKFSRYFDLDNAVEYFRYKDVVLWKDQSNNSFQIHYKDLQLPEEQSLGAAEDEISLLFGALKKRFRKHGKSTEDTNIIEEARDKWKERDTPTSKQSKQDEPTLIYTPCVKTAEFIAEEIWDRVSQPKFAMLTLSNKEIKIVDEIRLATKDKREIIYKPILNDTLTKNVITVPEKPMECTMKEVLQVMDSDYIFKFYDAVENESSLRHIARVAVGSWYLDRFINEIDIAGAGKFAPIIPIRGPSGSGKNRLANLLRFIAYRPYFTLATNRIPSLYRPLDVWKGATLVMDEADFAGTNEYSELVHYLNSRATGTPITRQDQKEVNKSLVFSSFGMTILTQRRAFDDNATEGRCLPYYSDVSEKQLPTVEPEELAKMGMNLQNMLLYLRLRYFTDVQIDPYAQVDGIADHRLIASTLPLLALGKLEPAILGDIKTTLRTIQRTRTEMKANSDDGMVINQIWQRIEAGLFDIHNRKYYVRNKFYDEEKEVEQDIPLQASAIASNLKLSAKDVRKIVTSLNIGPENAPTFMLEAGKSYRPLFFDPLKLEKRLKEFVVDYEKGKLLKLVEEHMKQTKLDGGEGS